MRVKPMLKQIDRRDMRQERDDTLQIRSLRARMILRRIKHIQMLGAQQLHRHARDLAELDWPSAEKFKGLVEGRHRMKRMPAFVQQDDDVSLRAGGIHEDESLLRFAQCRLISPG